MDDLAKLLTLSDRELLLLTVQETHALRQAFEQRSHDDEKRWQMHQIHDDNAYVTRREYEPTRRMIWAAVTAGIGAAIASMFALIWKR